MVRKRLLQKRRSREATRAFVLKLTDEGRLLLAAADPVVRNLDAALLQGPAAGAAGAVYDGTAGGRPRAGGEIRLSGYDNSPNYGGPESSWREAAVIVLVIVLVIFIVAGAIWALHRLLLGSGVVN